MAQEVAPGIHYPKPQLSLMQGGQVSQARSHPCLLSQDHAPATHPCFPVTLRHLRWHLPMSPASSPSWDICTGEGGRRFDCGLHPFSVQKVPGAVLASSLDLVIIKTGHLSSPSQFTKPVPTVVPQKTHKAAALSFIHSFIHSLVDQEIDSPLVLVQDLVLVLMPSATAAFKRHRVKGSQRLGLRKQKPRGVLGDLVKVSSSGDRQRPRVWVQFPDGGSSYHSGELHPSPMIT